VQQPIPLARLSRRGLLQGLAQGLAMLAFCEAALADEAATISFDGLYKSFGVLGFQFSDRATSLRGQEVRMLGYMAPPLKPESHFFVLTREPLAICPFCQSDADWPVDIVVVFMKAVTPMVSAGPQGRGLRSSRNRLRNRCRTGFVSQIRLVDASFHIA
jgi:hypothetical protein